ncbi:MAG: hypothetical protein V3W44_04230 [Dehalococcoidales bacterium]
MAFNPLVLLPLIGFGFDLFSGKQERDAIKEETRAKEAAQRFNAAQTRREAARTREVGAEDEFALRRDLRHRLSRNRVATAGAGVEVTGTPLETELLLARDAAINIAIVEEQTRLESQELELLAQFQDQFATDVGKAGKIRRQGSTLRTVGHGLDFLGDILT